MARPGAQNLTSGLELGGNEELLVTKYVAGEGLCRERGNSLMSSWSGREACQ